MNDFENQIHPEETDDYRQFCEEEEYYASLYEDIILVDSLFSWLADDSMADEHLDVDIPF